MYGERKFETMPLICVWFFHSTAFLMKQPDFKYHLPVMSSTYPFMTGCTRSLGKGLGRICHYQLMSCHTDHTTLH